MLGILGSTLTLCFENPLEDPNSSKNNFLRYLDMFFTTLFIFEGLIKIIHGGLIINGKHSYFRSIWNIMDFFIVVFSLISYVDSG